MTWWGRPCTELPAFIIKRLPVRFTYDDNYFNALYQGIPNGGYTAMVEKMLDGTEVRLNVDYLADRENLNALAEKVVYTGPVDAYFGYRLGALQYRSVRFETEVLDTDNYQGNAVVNYTDAETPYTRIIEHKHFEFGTQPKTVISREYSAEWKKGDEPYYPVNDEKNGALYAEYKKLADAEPDVIFGGRLGEYKYYDMDKVIEVALDVAAKELALAGFCEGGRRVQIMTNAIESGANPFGCTDYLNEKKNILATGSEVFEVSCGQSLHTKTILVDDQRRSF